MTMAYAIRNIDEARATADDFGYDEELARWLEESGRRRCFATRNEGADIETSARAANGAMLLSLRRLVLAAVFGISAAQYLYADVELKIYRLPAMVVFVSPATP